MADSFTLDQKTIENLVTEAVKKDILSAVETLGQDPAWLARIEKMINEAVIYQTLTRLSGIDINSIINERVDANMDSFRKKLLTNFSSIGISDQATQNQMTVMDDHTVFENNLTTSCLTVAQTAEVQDLIVTGSINTNNRSWSALAAEISDRTLEKLSTEWQASLVAQVAEQIREKGIDFTQVTVEGAPLISGNTLNSTITQTNIQRVGTLGTLRVAGETHLNDTVTVINKRLGVNTEEPELALSVWDEEIAINIGKFKANQAYVGTSRAQGISFGTNRIPHIEIDADGMTQIKKLRIGVHQFSHADMVPGWAGTRGDIVFNSNPGNDRVFAWLCLGNYKWQPLKSAE